MIATLKINPCMLPAAPRYAALRETKPAVQITEKAEKKKKPRKVREN